MHFLNSLKWSLLYSRNHFRLFYFNVYLFLFFVQSHPHALPHWLWHLPTLRDTGPLLHFVVDSRHLCSIHHLSTHLQYINTGWLLLSRPSSLWKKVRAAILVTFVGSSSGLNLNTCCCDLRLYNENWIPSSLGIKIVGGKVLFRDNLNQILKATWRRLYCPVSATEGQSLLTQT